MSNLSPRQRTALHELRVSRGLLYRDPRRGYSAINAPPYFSRSTIKRLIELGLVVDEPSAGTRGGCRLTEAGWAEARRLRGESGQ